MAGPYLSVKELLSAPTGIDWSNVPVKGASQQQKEAAALRAIRRATAAISQKCEQKLWATSDTEVLELPGRRAVLSRGRLHIYTAYAPIIAVDQLTFSSDGVTYQPINGTVQLQRGTAQIPSMFTWVLGATPTLALSWNGDVAVTYRSGYANAKLTADAVDTDLLLHVDDPMGILPGDTMTIYDDELQEDIVVAANYVEGNSAVPLSTPLENPHKAGITISEMDEAIREAAILLATDYIRQRGSDTVAITAAGGTRVQQSSVSTNQDRALKMVEPWVRRL